jgi:phospholipase/carboxylesterase
MSDLLEAIEIETAPGPSASVIWMHGLGADGNDFVPILPELRLPETMPTRFIFPHAPMRPVTINLGMVMRAWFDVFDLGGSRGEDEAGVKASQARVEALIAREKSRGISASRIILAGFSQGGVMALHTGLRHPERLAGLMALSCFMPLGDTLAAEASPANRDVPIFMAHGTQDDLIHVERARQSRDILTGLGYPVTWHEYPMPHSVCVEEIGEIAKWLRGVLGAARKGA